MLTKKMFPYFLALVFSLACLAGNVTSVWAGGLSMNYAEVLVENLQVGITYSMRKVVNLPLEITNQSDAPIKISFQTQIPGLGLVKKGFEPIPDVSWVSLGDTQAIMNANSTFRTDVVISVPDDAKYFGKKYHINILANQVNENTKGPNVGLTLMGRLLFTVAPGKRAVALNRTDVDLNFELLPSRIDLSDVVLGQKTEVLTAQKQPVQVVNPNPKPMKMVLRNVDPKESVLSVEPGYEFCPDPNFITFGKEKLSVGPRAKGTVRMFLEIPDQEQYVGKKYLFIVAVTTGSGKVTQGKRYIRVLVSTRTVDATANDGNTTAAQAKP